ncbi:putative toxin-antitoxin system toxin component, PIN family [Anaerolactibacter massiliensis]|jgi:putative PIN family toxin of toxin-antitoxin system|uniref:putative toxin-antitoxin system toxin component, PIN family n=1 Tax=Anaerolactibacter massiliensis TaxID=2044573 RepID=UPI000CF8DB4E|nr:putative toxin-antitoxin system toxin component, PIN family [Anaerolactibacter massiliensis]MBQ9613154.1 putative toxin-antitoxin system toxin component, PIN family [Lachnospiraceae bacterium]HAL60159.1 putative toxin-antitoxin system toxin component, PIN family [Sarcina sp.]
MKYYVVIDTNVLVSAVLKSHSVPGSIVELAFDGPIIPILNEAIEKEYREVLSRPKFHLPEDLIEGIMSTFHKRAIYVDAEHLDVELPDPKDLVFYEVVMEERKEEEAYLVTGNIRHFPNRPFIVTPREMLDIILRDQDFRDE